MNIPHRMNRLALEKRSPANKKLSLVTIPDEGCGSQPHTQKLRDANREETDCRNEDSQDYKCYRSASISWINNIH